MAEDKKNTDNTPANTPTPEEAQAPTEVDITALIAQLSPEQLAAFVAKATGQAPAQVDTRPTFNIGDDNRWRVTGADTFLARGFVDQQLVQGIGFASPIPKRGMYFYNRVMDYINDPETVAAELEESLDKRIVCVGQYACLDRNGQHLHGTRDDWHGSQFEQTRAFILNYHDALKGRTPRIEVPKTLGNTSRQNRTRPTQDGNYNAPTLIPAGASLAAQHANAPLAAELEGDIAV